MPCLPLKMICRHGDVESGVKELALPKLSADASMELPFCTLYMTLAELHCGGQTWRTRTMHG